MEMLQKSSRELEVLVSTYTTKVDNLERRVQELEKSRTELHAEFEKLFSFLNESCENLAKIVVNGHSALPRENSSGEYNTNSNNNGSGGFNSANSLTVFQKGNVESSYHSVKASPIVPAAPNKGLLSQTSLLIPSTSNPLHSVSYLAKEEEREEEEYEKDDDNEEEGENHEEKFSKNHVATSTHHAAIKQRTWSPRRLFNKKSRAAHSISSNTKGFLEERRSFNALRNEPPG
jgi:hypothetical protein